MSDGELIGWPVGNPPIGLLLFGQVFFISAYPADMKMNTSTLPGINDTIYRSFRTQ
jgi:hypothetical protein